LRINSEVPWSVNYTSRVTIPEKIKIGIDVSKSFVLSGSCYIQGGNGIEIGDYTIFAPGVKIISSNHNSEISNSEWIKRKPIKIGKYCWIGANAIILPEVELGDYTVVGAGTVITKNFPEGFVVIAGNPARLIRYLKND